MNPNTFAKVHFGIQEEMLEASPGVPNEQILGEFPKIPINYKVGRAGDEFLKLLIVLQW